MKRYPLLIQLLVSVLVTFFVLVGLLGTVYYKTSSAAIRLTTEQKTRETIQQSSQFVSSYISRLKEMTSALANHTSLKTYAETASQQDKLAVSQLLSTILKTDADLVSALYVTKKGDVISTNPHLAMTTSSDMMEEMWYQKAIHENAMPVLTPAHQHQGLDSDGWVISVTQEVTDDKGDNLGVVRLDIDYKTLAFYLDKLNLGEDGFSFIVNQQHEFVYHPRKIVYTSSKEMAAMAPYLAITDGYTEDHRAFVYQIEVPDSQWTLIGVASLDGLTMLQKNLFWTLFGTGLLAMVLGVLGIWWLLGWWIKPLREFREVILQVGEGQSRLRAKETGSSELIDLTRQFNGMLDQIDLLMQSIKDKEQAIRAYELQALSSQINPHFLYNTLDTIIWMAEFNDRERVVELTKSLAKYFRLALNKGNEQIQLKNELDHVRQYLFIQKQRYGDKLTYQIDELPAYDDYILPKLVLQPIVENAIYHGIKEVDRQGEIRLSVTDTSEQLVITIEDNGKGISSDKEPSTILLGGVGLKNVDDRLRLQFGSDYQMRIDTKQNSHTRIMLCLPKLREF